eukprot:213009_1
MDEIRIDIINTCNNKTGNDLYQLKINYTEISDQLEKESSIFNQLLKNLNENDFINHTNIIHNHNMSEIIDNTSLHSDIYTPHKQQSYDSYDNIPEIPQSNQEIPVINKLDWSYSVESTAETKTNTVIGSDINITIENNKKSSNARKRRLRRKKANINSTNNIRPTTKGSNSKLDKSKANPKQTNVKDMTTKRKMNSGAHYSSTLLFCKETCNLNANVLRNHLIDCSKWRNNMIEEIIFKEGNYNNYALIRVRGHMECVNDGIEKINSYYYQDAIQIFKRYKDRNNVNMNGINACNVLYVNNFDILGKNTIKKISNLFLKYGKLERDIKMGTDRVNDPYAIVYFKNVKDAKKCVEKELKFCGKVLSVKFSKFGN